MKKHSPNMYMMILANVIVPNPKVIAKKFVIFVERRFIVKVLNADWVVFKIS